VKLPRHFRRRMAGSRMSMYVRRIELTNQAGDAQRCPLWVINGHNDKSALCPLLPNNGG